MAKKIIIVRKKKTEQKAPKPAVVAEVAKVVKANKRPKAKPIETNVTIRKSKKSGANIDWSIIRTAYITDVKETHRSLEQRYGVARSSIANHAKKEDWASQRQEWLKKAESNVLEAAGEDREEQIKSITTKHANLLDKLSEKISRATEELSMDEWAAKNLESLAKASKLVIEGERLTVGLPSDVKGLSDPRGDKLNVTIESLHEKAKEVLNGKNNS